MDDLKEEKTVREEVIDDLMNKKIRLSYSALKNFTSPINLVNYYVKKRTQQKVQTPAMLEGIASDVYLLEPHNYESKIEVIDKVPTTAIQVGFTQDLLLSIKDQEISDELIQKAYSNHYSKGTPDKIYESLKPYINATSLGKTIIDSATDKRVKELTDALNMQMDVSLLMSRISSVQKRLEWQDEGWDFIAYLDMELEEEDICDVKRTKDAEPDFFERDIRYNKYYFQGGMYCYAYYLLYGKLPNYTLLAYDTTSNYDIFKLDYGYIQYGITEYRYKLEQLNKAIKTNSFWKSYGFFKPDRQVYKPKWVQGFELEKPMKKLYKNTYQEPKN